MKTDEIVFLILLFLISFFSFVFAILDAKSGLRSVQSVITDVAKDGGVILLLLIVFIFDENPTFQVFALLILSVFYGYSAFQLRRTVQIRTGKFHAQFWIQVGFAVGCALASLASLTRVTEVGTFAFIVYGVTFLAKLLRQAVIKWEEQSQATRKVNPPSVGE